VKPAAADDGSATATIQRKLLEPPELIRLSAIWIDLIEPTVEEDRKVQEFVGAPVSTKADPDYAEPPVRYHPVETFDLFSRKLCKAP
jgi:Mg2+ and Co2+ transporter CorA